MPRFELLKPTHQHRPGWNPFRRKASFQRQERISFWEVERYGTTLQFCSDDRDGNVRRRRRVYPNEDEARMGMAKLVVVKKRAGFVEAGASRELEPAERPMRPGSALLIDEHFARGDERFLDEVLRFAGAARLAALAPPWYSDTRPFARTMLLAYIDDGCDRPHHKALVKRLFKLAEGNADDEAMAHFLVAFDRLLGRSLVRVGGRWNEARRFVEPILGLRGDPSLPRRLARRENGRHEESPRFSRNTRAYLARRAFRYFRIIGYKDPARYGRAACMVLPLYREEHLNAPARLFDAWGLMHILYGWSPILDKAPRGLRIREGRSLSELEPAPYFPAAWEGAFRSLLNLLASARSRTVRVWALTLLRSQYARELEATAFEDVKRLLTSAYEEPPLVGADLLETSKGLESVPMGAWLDLLRIGHVDALMRVCVLANRYVDAARLTLHQCIDLGGSRVAPVAALGLGWAQQKDIACRDDLTTVLKIAHARVASVRTEGVVWCASLLETLPFSTPENLRDMCDAPFADARAPALECLASVQRFRTDVQLWFALTESPYPDVRAFTAKHAQAWVQNATPGTLVHLWSTALLSVHTGSAAKPRVSRDIANRIAEHPEDAEVLLPVLGQLLRSIRPAERAWALTAVARAAIHNTTVQAAVGRLLPDVVLSGQVAL